MFGLFALLVVHKMEVQQDWTPQRIEAAIKSHTLTDVDEARLVKYFGGEEKLKAGPDAKVEELTAAFAVRVDPSTSRVEVLGPAGLPDLGLCAQDRFPYLLDLVKVGAHGLWVGADTYKEGTGFRWQYIVGGRDHLGKLRDLEVYATPPEAKPAPQQGKLEQQPPLTSKIFGGTKHDWWIYTPPGYDPAVESNLIVFQDGQWSHGYAPVYFDNMIPNGDLKQTVVVFVTPGTFPDGKSDRSREYDTLNNMYVRFLLEELLPPVEAKYKITQDPRRRCVAGLSSGGVASFTAAWQRPDKFGLVMSWVGSFTDIASGPTLIEGGHNYPSLIRKSPHKPIRVFLQDGENDLDNEHGNWPLSNHQMAKALEFAKYDCKAVFGNGFHSDKHGRAIMADCLRWLFRP